MNGHRTRSRRATGAPGTKRKVAAASPRKVTKAVSPRSKSASSDRTKALRKTISNGVRREAVKSGNRVKRRAR